MSRKKDAFTFGLAEFSNIDELNEHFLNQPFIGGESGADFRIIKLLFLRVVCVLVLTLEKV